ncbi:hypothetical protein Halar_2568 [halophilic archaeon DL31]|jgi:hypothetical protein|nr:hypothetical protein Halar_2568 [halophilic archaeon DL31]
MSVLDSLPDRPLTDAELTSFNRSDALEIAVNVSEAESKTPGDVSALLLATESWVKGLVHGEGGWRVVATCDLGDDEERFDAMQHCEEAVREAIDEE